MPRNPIPPEMTLHGRSLPRLDENGRRLVTVASCVNPRPRTRTDRVLPMIRLRGRWLRQLGFDSGERIVVTVEGKRLVLTVAEK